VRVERHWHVIERYGRSRLFAPRMRIVLSLGADTAEAAFSAFSQRANELMLDGWELDTYGSSDCVLAVRKDLESRIVEVCDCYDPSCLAGRPPRRLADETGDHNTQIEPHPETPAS
jgi:hypothetical protein